MWGNLKYLVKLQAIAHRNKWLNVSFMNVNENIKLLSLHEIQKNLGQCTYTATQIWKQTDLTKKRH